MMSRLNQSNTGIALFSQRWGIPEIVGLCVRAVQMRGAPALGYRIPSSPMPRPALAQPDHRQPAAPDQAVLGKRLDGVLTTGRTEPARGHPHRRHGVAVQGAEESLAARGRRTD